jgi:hypothetical protein|nr:MAG TPA: hypothetical protein [Caudoviricetes sp.]
MFKFVEEFKLLRIACDILDTVKNEQFRLIKINSEEIRYSFDDNTIFVTVDSNAVFVVGEQIDTAFIRVKNLNFICRWLYARKYQSLRNLEIRRIIK